MALSDTFDAALSFGTDYSFDTPRSADTQTSDAIQSSQPITNDGGQSWSGFWQNTIGSVLGYAAARDQAQAQAANGSVVAQQAAVRGSSGMGGLVPLIGLGLIVFLLMERK